MSHDEAFSVSDRTVPKQLRSTVKTARMLDCSVRTVYRLVDRGELVPVRLGRVLRFEEGDLVRYLDRHREAAT